MTDVMQPLTWWEIWLAAEVARQKWADNMRTGARERHGTKSEFGGLDIHFQGCLGELATAKYLGLFWSGNVGFKDRPDIAGNVQVRATPSHHLRLHKTDKPDEPFVLAITRIALLPNVCLRGWMFARDGQHEENWRVMREGNDPAYWVEGTLPPLRPMNELFKEVKRAEDVSQEGIDRSGALATGDRHDQRDDQRGGRRQG